MSKCTIPSEGWTCTRQAGHDGPCAAIPATVETSEIQRLTQENERLRGERDKALLAIDRVCITLQHPAKREDLPQIVHSIVKTNADLTGEAAQLRARIADLESINRTAADRWAELDTAIKAVCAKRGIYTERVGNFKPAEECVEELSAKVAALEADRERLDWVMRNVSGAAWASLGIFYSDGCTRADLDAAIDAARAAEQP